MAALGDLEMVVIEGLQVQYVVGYVVRSHNEEQAMDAHLNILNRWLDVPCMYQQAYHSLLLLLSDSVGSERLGWVGTHTNTTSKMWN